MARLSKNVVLRHPESGELVSLEAGSDVPGWAEDLVDEHVLEVDVPHEERDQPESDEPGSDESRRRGRRPRET